MHSDPSKREPEWVRSASGRLVREEPRLRLSECQKLGERRSRHYAGESVEFTPADEKYWDEECEDRPENTIYITPLSAEEEDKLRPSERKGGEEPMLTVEQCTYYAGVIGDLASGPFLDGNWFDPNECREANILHVLLPLTLYFAYSIAPALIGKDKVAAIFFELSPHTAEMKNIDVSGYGYHEGWARRQLMPVIEEPEVPAPGSVTWDPNWNYARKVRFLTARINEFRRHFPDREKWLGTVYVPGHATSFVLDFENERLEIYDTSHMVEGLQIDFFRILDIVLLRIFDIEFERFVCLDYWSDPHQAKHFGERGGPDWCDAFLANPLVQKRSTCALWTMFILYLRLFNSAETVQAFLISVQMEGMSGRLDVFLDRFQQVVKHAYRLCQERNLEPELRRKLFGTKERPSFSSQNWFKVILAASRCRAGEAADVLESRASDWYQTISKEVREGGPRWARGEARDRMVSSKGGGVLADLKFGRQGCTIL